MHVRVEINSIGRWETARHHETDEPMDYEEGEVPSEAELLLIKRHNSVNRRRIRVVVDGVPIVEDRPGTKVFNLGTEEGRVQLPHGAPTPAAFLPTPEPEPEPEPEEVDEAHVHEIPPPPLEPPEPPAPPEPPPAPWRPGAR